MRIIYVDPNNIPLGDELQIVQLNSVEMKPIFDPTRVDYWYSEITLDVTFQWQPFATTTAIGKANRPTLGQEGDPLYLSVRHLRERLNYPRRALVVVVGNSTIWQSPETGPNGNILPCDPGNGPFPRVLSLTAIEGEYGAVGRWRVTFHKRFANSVLMSNRWSTRIITNAAGISTRIITGYAAMRADFVGLAGSGTIDDFRNWLFCPCPAGFHRESIDVTVAERGDKARWIVVDQEDANPMGHLGADIGAVRFTGGSTVSSGVSIKGWSQGVGVAEHGVRGGPWGILAAGIQFAKSSFIADSSALVWSQVWGGKDVLKSQLVNLAIRLCLDRANNGTNLESWFFSIERITISQGIGESESDGRWIRAEIMYRPSFSTALSNKVHIGNVTSAVNYSNDVTPVDPDGSKPGLTNPTFPGDSPAPPIGVLSPAESKYYNAGLPWGVRNMNGQGALIENNVAPLISDGGSRGGYLGALIAQALQTPFDPTNLGANPAPAAAPPAEAVANLAGKIV